MKRRFSVVGTQRVEFEESVPESQIAYVAYVGKVSVRFDLREGQKVRIIGKAEVGTAATLA